MLSLVHPIYMAGDKCMGQNACFYIEIITGIKLDKNNTYGHLKLTI